jgi:hypothetical protein
MKLAGIASKLRVYHDKKTEKALGAYCPRRGN